MGFDPRAQGGRHALELGFGRAGYSGEEVVRSLDEDDVARLRGRDEVAFENAARAELVVIAGDEQLRYGAAGGQEIVAIIATGSTNGKAETRQPADTGVSAAGAQANVGAKGKTGEQDREVESDRQPVQSGAHVIDLAATFVVRAFAEASAAEIEAKSREAEVGKGLGRVIDHLIVHCASAERMRVSDKRGIERVRMACIEQSFETAGGTAQVFDGLYVGTEWRHRDEFTGTSRNFRGLRLALRYSRLTSYILFTN